MKVDQQDPPHEEPSGTISRKEWQIKAEKERRRLRVKRRRKAAKRHGEAKGWKP